MEVLKHPNIVEFQEQYTSHQRGVLNIVLEYADSGDLAQKIRERKGKGKAVHWSEDQVLDWFTQICLAVKHVHDRKILHRDIKPSNVFLSGKDKVKLGDFGIAKVLNKTKSNAKSFVGTSYYMSPEILKGK